MPTRKKVKPLLGLSLRNEILDTWKKYHSRGMTNESIFVVLAELNTEVAEWAISGNAVEPEMFRIGGRLNPADFLGVKSA